MTKARQARARLHLSQFRYRRIRSSMVMDISSETLIVCHRLRRGKGLAASAMVYLPCLEELSVPGAALLHDVSVSARNKSADQAPSTTAGQAGSAARVWPPGTAQAGGRAVPGRPVAGAPARTARPGGAPRHLAPDYPRGRGNPRSFQDSDHCPRAGGRVAPGAMLG